MPCFVTVQVCQHVPCPNADPVKATLCCYGNIPGMAKSNWKLNSIDTPAARQHPVHQFIINGMNAQSLCDEPGGSFIVTRARGQGKGQPETME